jgi:hypothetical protein
VKRSAVHANRQRAALCATAAALILGLAGCSTMSPATTTLPYDAADGTSGVIPGSTIKLRNFVVVSAAKGAPGQVVGAVANSGGRPVVVTMQTALGETGQPTVTRIRVPAHGLTAIGPSGTEIAISDTPVEPGALMSISANSASNGGITLTVPVFPPSSYYSSFTPAPTTDAPSPTDTADADPEATPDASASPASSKKPAKTPTATPTSTS